MINITIPWKPIINQYEPYLLTITPRVFPTNRLFHDNTLKWYPPYPSWSPMAIYSMYQILNIPLEQVIIISEFYISPISIWVQVKMQGMDQGPGPTRDPYPTIHTPIHTPSCNPIHTPRSIPPIIHDIPWFTTIVILWFAAIWAGGQRI